MDKSAYHEDYDHISKTMISDFVDSRNMYYRYYVEKSMRKPTPKAPMVIGSAIHAILLDKLSPAQCIAVYDDDCFKHDRFGRQCGLNPKPADEFREEHKGKLCLKPAEMLIVRKAVEAVRNHPLGQIVADENAVFETPMYWTCESTDLKCRMCGDIVVVDESEKTIWCYDIKTTARPEPANFERVQRRLRYWLQDAHYSAGLRSQFGREYDVRFKFWAIETSPPFRIAPYEFPQHQRDEIAERYSHIMSQIYFAYESGEWNDPWTAQTNYMVMRPWDFDDEGGELQFDGEEEHYAD